MFVLIVAGSGVVYHYLAQRAGEDIESIPATIYLVLGLTFLQSGSDFPHTWYLQIFYFLMPVAGIAILAQGLADFGVLFFNRRARGKEWEMAVASTFNNHIVLIGLGHLGFRVVKKLYEMNQDVVVIELNPKIELLEAVRSIGIPVIEDDGTRESVLTAAGIRRARAILLCTQNDSLNLQMAVKARNLNPKVEVVVRIFDDEFAESLHKQFGFRALSATGMAAPIFAASAANIDITAPITIDGQPNSLARLQIGPRSRLNRHSINDIEDRYKLSIVLLTRDGQSNQHPQGDIILCPGDIVAIFGQPDQINHLVHDNHA